MRNTLTRRHLLAGAVLGTAALTGALMPGATFAADPITLRISTPAVPGD